MIFTEKELFEAAATYRDYLANPNTPVNLVDQVELPDIFSPVIANAESAARAAHNEWLADAISRGVTKDENPNCVPYEELDEEIKASNISVALRTYKILVYLGVGFSSDSNMCLFQADMDKIITAAVEIIHDGWAKDKLAAGWIFAPERDNQMKHHTDLVDMRTLLSVWPGKDEWDRNAVIGVLKSLADDYGIYPTSWENTTATD